MKDIDIWEQLFSVLQEDEDYRKTIDLIRELEPVYLAALESLNDIQREQIERYISACDLQGDCMIFQAYRLGCEQGRKNAFRIKAK